MESTTTTQPAAEQRKRSRAEGRRALLGIAAASIAGAAARNLLSPTRTEAAPTAMNTETIYNTAAQGGINMDTDSGAAWYARNVRASPGQRMGLYASTGDDSTVVTGDGAAVVGFGGAGSRVGVLGQANHADGVGVRAQNLAGGGKALDVIGRGAVAVTGATGGIAFQVTHDDLDAQGIVGQIGAGTPDGTPAGVVGFSGGTEGGAGVFGHSTGDDGAGVSGYSTHPSGAGVAASHGAGGAALRVVGKASVLALLDGTAMTVSNIAVSGSPAGLRGSVGTGTPAVVSAGLHGFSGDRTDGVGVVGEATGFRAIGVAGSSADADGAGVAASNSAGGKALLVDGRSSFNGNSSFTGAATFSSSVAAASFAGGGAALTGLSASNIASGMLNDARLSGNIPRKKAAKNAFKGAVSAKTFTGAGGKALSLAGSGAGTIAAGSVSARINNPLCNVRSRILVTLQTSTGGASLLGVKPANGSFEVFLTGNASSAIKLAYLILK